AERDLAEAAQLASLSDETPEGRSIVVLAKERYGLRGGELDPAQARFVPFTAQTRLSGVDFQDVSIRKGAVDAVLAHVQPAPTATGRAVAMAVRTGAPDAAAREITALAERIARAGGTPL
ncbi:potassium-transporting ATPase subunit B, partial [Enterococcus faecium]